MTTIYGVGIIGAGPVTQAIHVPTLQRLADRFRVVHVMDVVPGVASPVAARVDARYSTDAAALIADPAVEIVAVCSPNAFHAEQVIAACRAGKRAVLCEKPLAMSPREAADIAAASTDFGVPVIVGTMHAYDPAWRRAIDAWEREEASPHTVRVSAMIPPNPRSEDFATQIVGRPPASDPLPRSADRDAANVHGGVMGLAIHDLPLARRVLPDARPVVRSALALAPGGYEIVAEVGDAILEIHGTSNAPWDPDWSLEAVATTAALSIDFPIPYVHAGSAVARHTSRDRPVEYGRYPQSGYEAEWLHLHDVVSGATPPPDPTVIVDDVLFALEIADQAADLIRSGRETR